MTHSSRLLVSTLLVLASSGCTIVADLDSYVSVDDLGCDMQLQLVAFTPHLTEPMYFQAATRDTNELRAMAIIDTLTVPDRRFVMPNAIAEGAHALNFWADDGVRDMVVQTSPFVGADHSWRSADVCNFASNCESGEPNCFTHATPFDMITNAIELGNALSLNLTELPAAAGFVEVHLIENDVDAGLRRVVGLYRKDDGGAASTLNVLLPGLIFPGRLYSVDVLVDKDGDRSIDPATEVFSVTEADGSAYLDPITLNLTTSDPTNELPPEVGPDEDFPEQLFSPLPAP